MPHANPTFRPAMSVVEQVLLGLLFLGAVAILSLPAARATDGILGWVPLWLLALPATSLLTACVLRWSRHVRTVPVAGAPARRRRNAVAVPLPSRRSARRGRLPRAA